MTSVAHHQQGHAATRQPVQIIRRRRLSVVIGTMILAGSLWLANGFVKDAARFPVDQVDVLGTLDYADRDALVEMVKTHTIKGFFGLDIDQLRDSIETFEWVESALVSRVWPSTITVVVEEHEPAARWNDHSLISKRLTVFHPPQLNPQGESFRQWRAVFEPLPQLRDTAGRQADLLELYRVYEQRLSGLGHQLVLLEEDDRQSQTLLLANGTLVQLGNEKHELRMQRFLDVYPRVLHERASEYSAASSLSFDMRYSNGFALGFVQRPVAG